MKFGYLKDFFAAYASKRLTSVEVDPDSSNGHEFNASSRLRQILGTRERKCKEGTGFPTKCLYLNDDEAEGVVEGDACLSWYDSRARHPTRTEWRLYYTDNPVFGISGRAKAGDTLIIAFSAGLKTATALAAPRGSTAESQLRWLFGIVDEEHDQFIPSEVSPNEVVDAARAHILEAIGIEVPASDDDLLARLLERFKGGFPRSSVFSDFARAESPDVGGRSADEVLVTWMEKEELAFRVLERHLVKERLAVGFSNVDDFIALSLSVQNRRKARAGRAFENHLREIFIRRLLTFEQGPRLDDLTRPDFLFPGTSQYLDEHFPLELLTLLGAKTTCKDRWRQVLSEGKRMTERYLVTLEPAISTNQLAEMRGSSLHLVVPAALHSTYPISERSGIRSLEDFLEIVGDRQKRSGSALMQA